MKQFLLLAAPGLTIRFRLYTDAAPVTSNAFFNALPLSRVFFHARVSGQEVWTDQGAGLDIIQENASVFAMPGEMVLGPLKPERTKTANCLGIYYGEGKGLDCCNIFAKVIDEDLHLLQQLGEDIWKNGSRELAFTQG